MTIEIVNIENGKSKTIKVEKDQAEFVAEKILNENPDFLIFIHA